MATQTNSPAAPAGEFVSRDFTEWLIAKSAIKGRFRGTQRLAGISILKHLRPRGRRRDVTRRLRTPTKYGVLGISREVFFMDAEAGIRPFGANRTCATKAANQGSNLETRQRLRSSPPSSSRTQQA
jgi:hypothetical protein